MQALAGGLNQSTEEAVYDAERIGPQRRPRPEPVDGPDKLYESWDTRDRGRPAAAWAPTALAGLIESEIIPRMLAAHREEDALAPIAHAAPPVIELLEADAFADLVLEHEAYSLLGIVDGFLDRGIAVEDLLVDLLAPVARRLGAYWEEDRCDFVDVTMGLWRLQEIVHELETRRPAARRGAADGGRVLFAAMPGDQHSFGLSLVEDCFARAGWNTSSHAAGSNSALLGMVARSWFDIVGLTVTCEAQIAQLPGLIGAIRAASRNPQIGVMVGGPMLVARPEVALQSGADATAPDGRQAVARANILLEMLESFGTSPS